MSERSPDQIENARATADALRARLREALTEARDALSRAEDTNSQLHRELDSITASSARRVFVGARQAATRTARAVRHPAWTIGTVARGFAARSLPATAQRAVAHLVGRTFPLRVSPPVRRWAEGPEQSFALRWVGAVNIRHRRVEALLCHPPAGIEYRATAPAGATFVCECGLSPQVWQEHPPAVEFTATVAVPATGWSRAVSLTVDPGRRWTDRRWHTLSVPLPATDQPSLDVTVTLSTAVASGVSVDHAWALLGEPRFEWRRSRGEVRHSVGTFARLVRANGLRASLELARTAGIARSDADSYPRWLARHAPKEADLAELARRVEMLPRQPLISVIVPVYNTEPRWLRAAIDSVRRQVYPHWQLSLYDDASSSPETIETLREYEDDARIVVRYGGVNQGIAAASNAALDSATGDYVALLDHDDELAPQALAEVVEQINANPDADVFYSDEDKLDLAGGRCEPCFKPRWSPEHFLSCMYTCHLMVIRRSVLLDVGGFRTGYEGAQDYDLLLRIVDRTNRIHHIPSVLYHWRMLPQSTASAGLAKPWALDAGQRALSDYVRRNGIDAEVVNGGAPGLYRVRRTVRGQPLVSIIIPTAGKLRDSGGRSIDVLAQAISSVVNKTDYRNYEFIVVVNGPGVQESTTRALGGTRHRVVTFERLGLFNFSASINAGAAVAAGEQLLLFNDDLEVIDPDWLTAMLEYSQEPAVGAVGAKLVYPDGRLQHIGIVLGVAGVAAHAFHQHPGVSPGYFGSAMIPRNYSAVTGACLMTRREVFEKVGRFDERFPIDFNDVDYCLRVGQAGHRVVYTPWARLYHHESVSFGARRQEAEGLGEMRRRWGHLIDRDPYYSPHLTRDFPDFRIDA